MISNGIDDMSYEGLQSSLLTDVAMKGMRGRYLVKPQVQIPNPDLNPEIE